MAYYTYQIEDVSFVCNDHGCFLNVGQRSYHNKITRVGESLQVVDLGFLRLHVGVTKKVEFKILPFRIDFKSYISYRFNLTRNRLLSTE